MTILKNRIVAHDDVAPDQLLASPSNYRRHPTTQLEALRGSLRELGWVKTIIVNRRTGHVVDGHARVEEAMRQGAPTVPVSYVDLDPQEELLALASLDPMAELAVHDEDSLDELLKEVQSQEPGLQQMLDDIRTMPRRANGGVREVDPTSQVADTFWMAVRGPLPAQVDAVRKLKEALESLPGVEVELGTTQRDDA
jgi:hypothetical protein